MEWAADRHRLRLEGWTMNHRSVQRMWRENAQAIHVGSRCRAAEAIDTIEELLKREPAAHSFADGQRPGIHH